VHIFWNRGTCDNVEEARRTLRELPSMGTCEITDWKSASEPLVDEDVVLNLVGKASVTDIHSYELVIAMTPTGLLRACEMIYRSQNVKSLQCYVAGTVMDALFVKLSTMEKAHRREDFLSVYKPNDAVCRIIMFTPKGLASSRTH
ncbi:hypothetical protein PENTCL1PPCAC_5129, partial [Pristionchus entomophagus]